MRYCQFCNEKEGKIQHFSDVRYISIEIEERNKLCVTTALEDTIDTYTAIWHIHYCPFCGKKLNKDFKREVNYDK